MSLAITGAEPPPIIGGIGGMGGIGAVRRYPLQSLMSVIVVPRLATQNKNRNIQRISRVSRLVASVPWRRRLRASGKLWPVAAAAAVVLLGILVPLAPRLLGNAAPSRLALIGAPIAVVARVLLELPRLVARRKGAFTATRWGRALVAPDRAGELYALLVRTCFRELNLAYLTRGPENPGLQQTVAFTLFRLATEARDWRGADALAPEVLLPEVRAAGVLPAGYDMAPWQLSGMVLIPLAWFGLFEERRVPEPENSWGRLEYRKTSLYERVLRFDFQSPPTGGQPALRVVK